LVEVYTPRAEEPPDLGELERPFGFPHPLLSNNGVYAVLLFEQAPAGTGQNALARTRVQPTNAQTNIGGVADGSFDVTLGYEAVAALFADRGAPIRYALPRLGGESVTSPALCSVAVVTPSSPGAQALVRFLFEPATQERLAQVHFRPTVGAPDPVEAGNASGPPSEVRGGPHGTAPLDVSGARMVTYDWTQWSALDTALGRYVIT
jgi:hypothetical protein